MEVIKLLVGLKVISSGRETILSMTNLLIRARAVTQFLFFLTGTRDPRSCTSSPNRAFPTLN